MSLNNAQHTKFKAKSLKRKITKAVRSALYKFVRAPLELVIWDAWVRLAWLGDGIISRRNAINRLESLTWIEISPSDIKYYVQAHDVDRKHFIWTGEWDFRAPKMTVHQRYQLMEDLWRHRDALENSDTYKKMLDDLKQGIYHNHFNRGIQVTSPETALDLLSSQLEIFDSLKTRGYQPDLATDEIKVAVDRYGNLVKANGGRKRLSAAIICGLLKIPVRVAYVHKAWIEKHRSKGSNKQETLEQALKAVHQMHSIK